MDISLSLENRTIKLGLIQNIYIVHYSKLIDRKKLLLDQINKIHLDQLAPITWIENYDREVITEQQIKENYRYNLAYSPRIITIGEVANALAHMHIIETIAKNNEIALILEDDIILKPNFITQLNQILIDVPNDWEILTLGGWWYDLRIDINQEISNDPNDDRETKIVIPPRITTTVSCYILKGSTAKKIINHPRYKPFATAIDETLCHIVDTFKIYWVQPWLALEGSKEMKLFSTSFTERGF